MVERKRASAATLLKLRQELGSEAFMAACRWADTQATAQERGRTAKLGAPPKADTSAMREFWTACRDAGETVSSSDAWTSKYFKVSVATVRRLRSAHKS
jgi:hypothetical protein